MHRIRPHLSFANVVSSLALFVALGGGTAAALNGRNTVQSDDLGPGPQVRAEDVAKNAVNGLKVADNSLTGADLANNAVGGSEVAGNALNGLKIADNSLTLADLADNAVNGSKIVDGTVAGADLANNSVDGSKIVDDTVTKDEIADNAVNGPRIANNSVTGIDVAENTLAGFVPGAILRLDAPSDGLFRTIASTSIGGYQFRGQCVDTSALTTEFHLYASGPAGYSEGVYSMVDNETTDVGNASTSAVLPANVETKLLGFGKQGSPAFKRAGGTLTMRSSSGSMVVATFTVTVARASGNNACHIWGIAFTGT